MKKSILFFIGGVVLAIIITTGIRYFRMPEHTHHHANFALFIDGNRINFTDDKYSEEISACTASTNIQPRQRVHLHENNQDNVHVHHEGVTWGHFFANLGYSLHDTAIITDKGQLYAESDKKEITFILNGKEVANIANSMIKSEDRLLISYGNNTNDVTTLLETEYKQVASSAAEYNAKNDPASCSGGHGESVFDQILHAFIGE